MKKLFIAIGVGLISGSVYAACVGPFCWDDRGAYISGTVFDGNGDGTPSMTKALTQTTTPTATGQEIYCSDCTRSKICVSTGTTAGAYVVAVETGPMNPLTHCQ